jgi:hypothetical protein
MMPGLIVWLCSCAPAAHADDAPTEALIRKMYSYMKIDAVSIGAARKVTTGETVQYSILPGKTVYPVKLDYAISGKREIDYILFYKNEDGDWKQQLYDRKFF